MYSEKYALLISILPIYANQIFDGVKTIEFRKKAFQANVKKIVVYSTMPTGKIIGFWDFDGIEIKTPYEMWSQYSEVGGIEKSKFDAYFSNAELAFGIKVRNPVRFNSSVSINEIGKKPPQSYVYLTEAEFNEICRMGRA